MPFRDFCWLRRAAVVRGSSDTGRAWRFAGKSIATPGSRLTTESFSPANSSNRRHRAGTLTTRSFGRGTNSDGTRETAQAIGRGMDLVGDLANLDRTRAERMSTSVPIKTPLGILLAMTVVTGVVDAVSFLALGRVFAANMTGNTVLLGFAFGGATGLSVSRSSAALIAFLFGALVGGRMSLDVTGRGWVSRAFFVEASLLALSAALPMINPLLPYAVIASTAAAMGIQNAVARKLGVPDLTTTVLTLTITGLAADSRLAGGDSPRWQRRVAAIVAMAAGAAAGARMVMHSISLPLVICSVITAGCAIAHIRINSKRGQS
jgi:uncharacterized membrane protein YoaK (UPF0700 family)